MGARKKLGEMPFEGRVPSPVTPTPVRRRTHGLGDLSAIFPPLPSAPKVRTVPAPARAATREPGSAPPPGPRGSR